jgi:hypothetical protein
MLEHKRSRKWCKIHVEAAEKRPAEARPDDGQRGDEERRQAVELSLLADGSVDEKPARKYAGAFF